MSMTALLLAVRDTLRSGLDLDNQTCRIRIGPKPPPMVGDRFLAVFGTDWSPFDFDSNRAIDETFGVGVAVTYRSPYVPDDDQGEQLYIEAAESIESTCRLILGLVHQDYSQVFARANSYLTDRGHTQRFIEPLRFSSVDASPTPVGPEWFLASRGKSEMGGDEVAGLVMQVNFSGARRKQATGSIQ